MSSKQRFKLVLTKVNKEISSSELYLEAVFYVLLKRFTLDFFVLKTLYLTDGNSSKL